MDEGMHPPFPKKGDLGLAKNYRGITRTTIAAKIYNALLRNRIEPKIANILRKNQNSFRRNRFTTSQILTIRRILEGVRAKNLQATILFVDFTKAFDSIHRGKMEQILLAYDLPKETVAAITILCRNTKVRRTRHAGHCWRSRDELISDVLLWTPHIWPSKSRTTSSNVRIRDLALKTCQRRWLIGRSGERGSGVSVLAARHDDDDNNITYMTWYAIKSNQPNPILYGFEKVNSFSSHGVFTGFYDWSNNSCDHLCYQR